MNVRPKVSVIVPIYKVEKFIEPCIRSLLEQTIEDIEYVFVDDCSPDASMEILERVIKDYPERAEGIHIIRQSVNRGVAEARYRGMVEAKGEYVAMCDSDDWVEKDMYEKMHRKAQEMDADMVGCDFYEEYPDHRVYISQSFDMPQEECIKKMLYASIGGHLWRRLVKKEILNQCGLQLLSGVNMWEDLVICIKMHYFAKKVGYVDEGLYHYVQYNTGSLVHAVSSRQFKCMQTACRLMESFLKEQGIFEQYRLEFYERVFIAKLNLVFVPDLRDYQMWQTYYPESNKYICQYHIGMHNKILFTLLTWRLYCCVNLLLWMKKLFLGR